jgi:SPOR domain
LLWAAGCRTLSIDDSAQSFAPVIRFYADKNVMQHTPPIQAIRKTPVFTPYVVVWSMCGVLSLGIMTVLGLAPEWLEDLKPASFSAEPQSNQGQRAAARLAAEVSGMRDSIAQIQLDIAKVKTDVVLANTESKVLGAQIAGLEKRLSPAAAPVEAALPEAPQAMPPPPLPVSAEAKTDSPGVAAAQAIDPAIAAEPAAAPAAAPEPPAAGSARAPKLINADTQLAPGGIAIGSLETGSVGAPAKAASPVIAFGPAVVKPAPKPMGVQISSGASVDSLRLSWSLLADRHSDALKNLEARYLTSGNAENPAYDLVAGPIKTRAEAAKVCKALAAKNVPCKVGNFGGEAL